MLNTARNHRQDAAAFTLIELLVVVAMVAVLITVLAPALAAARRQGRVVTCLSNLRQLGHFTTFFNSEYRDAMPRSMHSAFASREMPWGYAFYPYATGQPFTEENQGWRDVFNTNYRCSLDRRRETNQWSYGYNVYYELTERETGTRTWRMATEIPRPSATVLFGEIGADEGVAMPDHVMAHFWTQFNAPAEVDRDRHGTKSGYVFVDGHASDLRFEQVFNRERELDLWNPARPR